MKTKERIRRPSRPTVVSVIPGHDIDVILHKKLEPKAVGRVHLLLVALSIGAKEYDSGILGVLEGCLIFYIFMLIDSFKFINC